MNVHRIRSVEFPSPAINALAFSHSNHAELGNDTVSALRLAVGRSNGDIEIWNPAQGLWIQETVFYGSKNRSIEGLTWIQEPDAVEERGNIINGKLRLFSIGGSSTVTEWNLETGLPLRNYSGTTEIWCLVAQPRLPHLKKPEDAISANVQGQNLLVGCADGTIMSLSTDDDDLNYLKTLNQPTKKKARVLSMAFQNRSRFVAGFSDSAIRIYAFGKQTCIRTITLGAGPVDGPREILVWAVKCFANGDIVTGDSTGEIRFYDGKTYSQVQRISAHEADIMDLAISDSTDTILSTGLDRRTSIFTRPDKSRGKGRWARSTQSTYHEHDVKAMARFESSRLSVVASGGLDTNLVITPVSSYWKDYHRNVSGLPQQPPLCSAPAARLFACFWAREVFIWRIEKDDRNRLVARIALKGDENITSAGISADGGLLAVASAADVRAFRLIPERRQEKDVLRVKFVGRVGSQGVRQIRFSPDGRWLAMVTNAGRIQQAHLHLDEDSQTLSSQIITLPRQLHGQARKPSPLGSYLTRVNRIDFSADSKHLVAGDLSGSIDAWILREQGKPNGVQTNGNDGHDSSEDNDTEDEDESDPVDGLVWAQNPAARDIPRLPSAPIILAPKQVKGSSDASIIIITAKHTIHEFSLKDGSLTEWSRRNPVAALPEKFTEQMDRAMGSFWGDNGWLWLYGSTWLFGLDVTADHDGEVKGSKEGETIQPEESKKRKRTEAWAGSKVNKRRDMRGLMRDTENENEVKAITNGAENGVDGSDAEAEDEADAQALELGLSDMTQRAKSKSGKAKWWMTLKYRPILGVVPITEPSSSAENPIEVALVERPVFELQLPDRFEGRHDK
jgi:U3 small nucleolar RNA-associated protein 4